MSFIYKYLRKAAVAIAGVALLVLGIVLIPLPGPGFLVIFAGLLVLSIEFEWARHHANRAKHHAKRLTSANKKSNK